MSGYDFLSDVTVLELAQLGPASLGGLLADMGARVIKIEAPGSGDAVRYEGAYAVGSADGSGYLHLRWNRGKKSVAVDLKTDAGADVFRRLAAKADIVVEGMRAGVLEKIGLGYEALKTLNPAIVFCSLSGLGASGPYASQASHGPAYDAFGALSKSPDDPVKSNWVGHQAPAIAMYAMGYPAALGALSALQRARRTGAGAYIEVAASDVAAHWSPEKVDSALNTDRQFTRSSFSNHAGRMLKWSRLDNYRTKDGRLILLQLYYDRFWLAFTELISRPDLAGLWQRDPLADDHAAVALETIIATKTRAEWMELLLAAGIPAMPVNTSEDLVRDPHFTQRGNTYRVDSPQTGPLTLCTTPVKTKGQAFAPTLAPALGEHTAEVLTDVLGLSEAELRALEGKGIIPPGDAALRPPS